MNTTNDAPLLQATSVSRHFGGLAAVDQVSIALHAGEVHAVIGTNGAGKSTLINMLSGEMPASGGASWLRGHDITGWDQARRARHRIDKSEAVAIERHARRRRLCGRNDLRCRDAGRMRLDRGCRRRRGWRRGWRRFSLPAACQAEQTGQHK